MSGEARTQPAAARLSLLAEEARANVHGSTVAVAERALMIVGPSGSGKSALALTLMALGAVLVADDRTLLESTDEGVSAAPHPELAGLIEARGVGLLQAEHRGSAMLCAVVDLAIEETDRLPAPMTIRLLRRDIPLFRRCSAPHFAPALLQFLKAGRRH